MSQSDLLKLSLVLLNVYLVLKLKIIVLLVMQTEAIHLLVHVTMDIMKMMLKYVLNVILNVSDVPLLAIVSMNVLETE
jgi:hypothetical protein